MVYSNKFIVAVKKQGKVLREFSNNTVRLPFGSDYTLLLKNKENRKALVRVKVDGKDVLDGNSIIVSPNEHTELKGFMKGSSVRNSFRFIDKTEEISNFRGNFLEDGLVEVTYTFEENNHDWYTRPNIMGSSSDLNVMYSSSLPVAKSCVSDSGITVPGRKTTQAFTVGKIGMLENITHSIIINLKGKVNTKEIRKAVTTKTKTTCPTCGRRWKTSLQYCGNCATYLHL